jgi:hypothetical protein
MRMSKESRNAGSPPSHFIISLSLDSETAISVAFSFLLPFFPVHVIRGSSPKICLNLRKSAKSADDHLRDLCVFSGEK